MECCQIFLLIFAIAESNNISFNKIADTALRNVDTWVGNNGLGNISVPELTFPKVGRRWLPQITCTEGKLQDISHIEKKGNVTFTFRNDSAYIGIHLGIENVDFQYKLCRLKYFVLDYVQRLTGSIASLGFYVEISFEKSFAKCEIRLEKALVEYMSGIQVNDRKTYVEQARSKFLELITSLFMGKLKRALSAQLESSVRKQLPFICRKIKKLNEEFMMI